MHTHRTVFRVLARGLVWCFTVLNTGFGIPVATQ
ncbi:MAG: hypothetical protein ACJASZ_001852 [Yoonia sp.]